MLLDHLIIVIAQKIEENKQEVPKKIVPDTIIKKNGRGGGGIAGTFLKKSELFLKSEPFFEWKLFLTGAFFERRHFLTKDFLPTLPYFTIHRKSSRYYHQINGMGGEGII